MDTLYKTVQSGVPLKILNESTDMGAYHNGSFNTIGYQGYIVVTIPAGFIFNSSIFEDYYKLSMNGSDSGSKTDLKFESVTGSYIDYNTTQKIATSEVEVTLNMTYEEMSRGLSSSFPDSLNIISQGTGFFFNIPPAGTIDDGKVVKPDDIFKSDPNEDWIEQAQIPMVLDGPSIYFRDDEIISYANSHANKQNQFVILGETVKVCSRDKNGVFIVRELSATFDIDAIAVELIPRVKEAILADMKIVISAEAKEDIVASLIFNEDENKYIMDYDTSLLDGSDYDISVTLGD